MNPLERLRKRLRGEPVDRPPNFDIVMAFAAHYIGRPLSHYYFDHRVLSEANLAVLKTFDLDIVQTISDPYREAVDLGLEVEFPEDGLPLRRSPLLADPADLRKLSRPGLALGRRMNDRVEAVRYLRKRVGGEVPILGWVEGALAEMNVLRGDSALMLDFYDRPQWVKECLELLVEIGIEFARAQIEAGADVIGLGDAIASQISRQMYEEFALPYEQRIFAVVRKMGAGARLHICGNTTRILPLMARSGADIIDLDWMVDMEAAAQIYGDEGPAICGNFDPVRIMLRGTPEEVRHAVLSCLESGGRHCISGAGCEIPDGTPHENLLAQTQALKSGTE